MIGCSCGWISETVGVSATSCTGGVGGGSLLGFIFRLRGCNSTEGAVGTGVGGAEGAGGSGSLVPA